MGQYISKLIANYGNLQKYRSQVWSLLPVQAHESLLAVPVPASMVFIEFLSWHQSLGS